MELGAIAAIGFLVLVIFLGVYAAVHAKKRRAALEELAPQLGLRTVEPPEAADVLPDLLFHPNGFSETPSAWGKWEVLRSRVLRAWEGSSAGRDMVLMDVSVDRWRTDMVGQRDQDSKQKQVNVTLIRCDAGPGGPPDFLVMEHVLFKGQVRGQRSINGPEQIGEHYFLFSDAPDAELERWITPSLRDTLGRHRLWMIASHDGVLFLARGTAQQQPDELRSFLSEAEALLSSMPR